MCFFSLSTVTETGILGEEHSNAILKLFVDSHIRDMNGRGSTIKPSIHSEIRRHEFFVSLIKIAIYKLITIPKKEISKMRKKGYEVSVAKATMPTVPAALERIYQDYLYPVLKKMPAGSKMRDALGSDEVLLLFHQHLKQLSNVFEEYAEANESDEASIHSKKDLPGIPSGSMALKQFGLFASDSGFVGGDESIRRFSLVNATESFIGNKPLVVTTGVTVKDVRQIFAASQHDIVINDAEKKVITTYDKDHQELMVFSEFLEAIARLGVLKYHNDSTLSHETCIKYAVAKVCKIDFTNM